jgi:3-oxoacyl-[acyl-carrier protein] reductase
MQIDLIGMNIVVAGASRGIGRAIALACTGAGASVSICARGLPTLHEARDEIAAMGGTVHAASCDLASEAAIESYIAEAAAALGGIDVLVNNASGLGSGDDEESWETSLAVDLLAVVRASRSALPHLLKRPGASIINIASGSGLNASPRTPAYGAAKAAVIHYTRTQAAKLAQHGIRVNCVAPAPSNSPAVFGTSASATRPRCMRRHWPVARWGGWGGWRRSPTSPPSSPHRSPVGSRRRSLA